MPSCSHGFWIPLCLPGSVSVGGAGGEQLQMAGRAVVRSYRTAGEEHPGKRDEQHRQGEIPAPNNEPGEVPEVHGVLSGVHDGQRAGRGVTLHGRVLASVPLLVKPWQARLGPPGTAAPSIGWTCRKDDRQTTPPATCRTWSWSRYVRCTTCTRMGPGEAQVQTSVVIAAHNEEAVIGRCLDALLADVPPGTLDVTVVANGCIDATAEVAAARPGVPVPVRAFYAINSRLPAYQRSLFGRGAVALSAAGRARFDRFPELTADDLFLDSLFSPAEKGEADEATSRVAAPLRTRDLIHRLARVRAGNATMRAASTGGQAPSGVRRSARLSWLRDVVVPRPWLAPAATCYVAITLTAVLQARWRARRGTAGWGRDSSTRQAGRRSPVAADRTTTATLENDG